MQFGSVMRVTDEAIEPLLEDVVLANGARLEHKTATVDLNGSRTVLREGEYVTADGERGKEKVLATWAAVDSLQLAPPLVLGSAPGPMPSQKPGPAPTQAQLERTRKYAQDKVNLRYGKDVVVYFATNRKANGSERQVLQFAGDRATSATKVTYGMAVVNIPPGHSIGKIESPYSLLGFEIGSNDPDKHVFVTQSSTRPKDVFFQNIRKDAARSKSAFMFVHGYNVGFDAAVKRTAQMASDLSFAGPALLFSWPSQGNTLGYTVDENNIVWATPDLKKFIVDALTTGGIEQLYIVGHSMGNRGLTAALVDLVAENPALAPRIKEIVLAAPDIDADIFREQIAPKLSNRFGGITLYASSKDQALLASQKVHKEPRAGQGGATLVVTKGVETVDASNIDTSLLGHSYIAEEQELLADLADLFKGQRAKQRFGLRNKSGRSGMYWYLKQ
ncbi:alpha/beta hydrolase [Hymenobacter canadensis]|uniref:Alpha/beta hydrolase n=1 Tax=Hymenobacter canadensis TaxID=2999067 RepID=A0ABY7LV24_9BACT|nr:alpha/beta hydrolase [Hymenobacter canadensis]WBA44238.1 alpha/beta hydrolase [Hymenobacter canadensis]